MKTHSQDTYFAYVNVDRRTQMPGEQAVNNYGNRANNYLLLHYGFCIPDNRYDSYAVNLLIKNLQDLKIPKLVDLSGEQDFS